MQFWLNSVWMLSELRVLSARSWRIAPPLLSPPEVPVFGEALGDQEEFRTRPTSHAPPWRVGVLGGGQLGQMLTLAGYPLGIETVCIDQTGDVPAARTGRVDTAPFHTTSALRDWAMNLDALTYEWENVPVPLVADLAEVCRVRPGPKALAIAQDRWHEKRLFDELAIPVAPFRLVRNQTELNAAVADLGFPAIAKTRTGGYDGKGQVKMHGEDELHGALRLLEGNEVIVEQFIEFAYEASVIGVRSEHGDVITYPLVKNEHRRGILHRSVLAPLSNSVDRERASQAVDYIVSLLKELDYVGVLTLELFATESQLLANEIAPRVHNSGHWTIEGAQTSQFENHLRAVVGLPLGSAEIRGLAAMVNLIGVTPPMDEILAISGAHVHLYGKDARPGRKLGHVTVTAENERALSERLGRVEAVVVNDLG